MIATNTNLVSKCLLFIVAAAVLVGCSPQPAAPNSEAALTKFVAALPVLPADQEALLDPATLDTRVPPPVAQEQKFNKTAAAPCCSSNEYRSLKVTYDVTVCKPLRDWLTAFEDVVVASPQRKLYRLNRGASASPLSQIICQQSSGPWDAALTTTRSCAGYEPVHNLYVSTPNQLAQFIWSGDVNNKPAGVGLVSCRSDLTTRFKCSGLSSCECRSSACPVGEECACGLEW